MKKFPSVKCPYCFEEIKYNDAVFRCNMGTKKQDNYLKAYHMENGNFAFSREDYDFIDPSDLNKNQIEMDKERRITGVENPNPAMRHFPLQQRLCPYCHNDLLKSFGREETRYIAVVGVPSSGKTTYLAALNDRMPQQERAWFSLDNEKNAPLDNITRLYRANQPGIGTATKSVQGPYLYELQYSNNLIREEKERLLEMKSHIVFFDVPGEFYSDVNKISQKLSLFLEKADGIIFIINAAEEVEHRREMQTEEFMSNVDTKRLVSVTDILQAFVQADIIKNKKTAIIFNKIDLIESEINLSEQAKLNIFPRPTAGQIDPAEIENLSSYTISQILGAGTAFQNPTQEALFGYMQKIRQVFGNESRVFATRMIREDPEDREKYTFVSSGAETPFLWLLSEMGVYPKKVENKQ